MKDSAKFTAFFTLSMMMIIVGVTLLIMDSVGIKVFIAIIVASIALIFVPILLFKGTEAHLDEEALVLSAPFVDARIPYSSIDSLSCVTEMDFGFRGFGYGGVKYGSGDFSNKMLGGYTRAASSAVPLVIIITSGKKKYAVNLKTLDDTRRLFDSISSRISPDKICDMPPMTEKEKRDVKHRYRAVIVLTAVILVVVTILVAWAMTAGHVDAELKDDRIEIRATLMNEDITYADITSVELRDDVDYGNRVGGMGNPKFSTGNFKNGEFGKYRLAIHNDVKECIVIHTTDMVVVFNMSDGESTASMYRELLDRIVDRTVGSTEKPYLQQMPVPI